TAPGGRGGPFAPVLKTAGASGTTLWGLTQKGVVRGRGRGEFQREEGARGERDRRGNGAASTFSPLPEESSIADACPSECLLALLRTCTVELLGYGRGLFPEGVTYARIG